MTKRTHSALAALLLPILVIIGGCEDENTGPDTKYDAEYALVKVNGETPPANIFTHQDDHGDFDVIVNEGTLSLASERYTISVEIVLEHEGEPALNQPWKLSGPFHIDGGTITFETDHPSGESVTGGYSENQITFRGEHESYGEVSLTFYKQ